MGKARLWIGLAIVVTLALSMGISVSAEPKPSDFWLSEFFWGEMGAIAGGMVCFKVGWYEGNPDRNQPQYHSICESIAHPFFPPPISDSCKHDYGCNLSYDISAFLTPINIGRALGASILVVVSGFSQGIEGNVWGTGIAAGLWLVMTKYNIQIARMPLVPAALATIGYNWGAKMKSDKSKPAALSWYLPLVALKF